MVTRLTAETRKGQHAPAGGHRLPGHDVVGDIAIVTLTSDQREDDQQIAAAILASNRRIRVVAARVSDYHGEFRTAALQVLAGENRLETEVKEFGVRLQLNVGEVYYSIRSGQERQRIAALVQPGEKVLVLFSGVAPFPLIISRYAKPQLIVGIEKNQIAHRYALLNCRLNRASDKIVLHCGDARELLGQLDMKFDRILMPLPTSASLFLGGALSVLQPGGWLHYYDMRAMESFADALIVVQDACARLGRQVITGQIHQCGHCSPKAYRICVDAQVS